MAEQSRRERKVISVVFADIVGSTARADALDPEDVEALLQPYHAQLKADFERFGGTVEKFIGDAVVAVFGAPIAHEDDPERAVRAALSIRDRIVEQGELRVRLAVTTGEAIVRLDASPERGEALATGDILNTASRLQGVAPENAILVDERTHEATDTAIRFDPTAAVSIKGKEEPVRVWVAVEARARFGVDVRQSARTPLVGRERERAILLDTLGRIESDRTPQVVTLVGVPGIGKSRLVYELFAELEQGPQLRRWRQGRSLPYGEGVSLWALAEIVKAQCGVLEDDDDAAVADKVLSAVRSAVPADEVDWIASELRPLVGLEASPTGIRSHRDEAFAAWRRFFEALADEHPLVLVFEDLHWADDTLLDFIEHLVDWAAGVPILVLCTTRPELLERRPGWGSARTNALTLRLTALSDVDSARLLSLALGTPVLPAETQQSLLEQAGGNPLFAVQFARLLQERGGDAADLQVPQTIHGLIAARLDALSPAEKATVQAASVMGKVFWAGALDLTLRDEATLHGLERNEFIRRERRSSVAGESEYAFRHILVRDVAYGLIPRADRFARHLAAAAWVESLGRPQDHAELVAHHYQAALELGGHALPPDLADRARDALIEAGHRATALNALGAAAAYLRAALDLLDEEDPRRPATLFDLGIALLKTPSRGDAEIAAAVDRLIAVGDVERAAEAEARLARNAWEVSDGPSWQRHLDRALVLIGDRPASPSRALVQAIRARILVIVGASEEGAAAAQDALAMAETFGLDDLRAHALNSLAFARSDLVGGGFEEMRESIAIAEAANSIEAYYGYNNLEVMFENAGRIDEAAAAWQESERLARQFGASSDVFWARFSGTYYGYQHGEWDATLREIDSLMTDPALPPGYYRRTTGHFRRALMQVARGQVDGPRADVTAAIELARGSGDGQQLIPTLGSGAYVQFITGDHQRARELADELLSIPAEKSRLVMSGLAATELFVFDRLGLAREFVAKFDAPTTTRWAEAAREVLAGDWAAAAEMYAGMGLTTDAVIARLAAAEDLVASGRRDEADAQLHLVMPFLRSVGATRYLAQAEELLAASA